MGFTWSYSKLKNFQTCPRRQYHIEILKEYHDEPSIELATGDALHRAMVRRVELGLPMPTAFSYLDDWGKDLVKVYHPKQVIMIEKELGITEDLQATGYHDPNVWLRCKIDHLKLIPYKGELVALAIDFKTGKPKDEIVQLAIYAQAIFSHWERVEAVRTEYWWTMAKDKESQVFRRHQMAKIWEHVLPQVREMQHAFESKNFPAKKSGLCREHCPVLSCEHNGRPK